jgi:hypothetical protein
MFCVHTIDFEPRESYNEIACYGNILLRQWKMQGK